MNQILLISGNPVAAQSWPARFAATLADSDERALELAQQGTFDAIVLDNSAGIFHGAKLRALLPILQPEATIFEGEGQGLQSEVREHFRQLSNARIRRYVVLNEIEENLPTGFPVFSAN